MGRERKRPAGPRPSAFSALQCGSHRAHRDPSVRPSSPSREEPGGRAVMAVTPRGRHGLLSVCSEHRPQTPRPGAQSHT